MTTKKHLSLHRETLRVLTDGQIGAVLGGVAQTRTARQPFDWTPFGGNGQYRPDQTVLQRQSKSYCLDKPPMSGYTLPPTCQD